MVENLAEKGRRQKVNKVTEVVEKDLVFPILESNDVKKWKISYNTYAIIPHDLRTARAISPTQLKILYPKTFAYFEKFKDILEMRSDFKSYAKNRLPYYFVYRFSDYTIAQYKVVWNQMGDQLAAAVVTPIMDAYLGSKPLIPEHVIAFISVKSEDEAHYICSILNSSLVNLVLQSIAKGGKNFATPEFINMINIERFNPSNNSLHQKLVELSKKAHQLAQRSQEDELRKVEEEIDKTVAQLYEITEDELEEVKKTLAMLEGEEFEEEEEEVAELPSTAPALSLRNNVVGENKPFNVEVVISNPLDKPLTNVSVKLKLFDGRFIEKNFERIQGEASFPLSFSGLKPGEYRVEAVFEYIFENTPKRFEKGLTIYVKGSEVKHVERSFNPEELFGV